MKVVYVIDSLANKGGAERIILNKIEYLAQHFGYDFSIITCYQDETTPNAYPLPKGVSQIYLGIHFYSQYKYHYPYRLIVKRRLARLLHNKLTKAVQDLDPDILIGVSYFEADVVTGIRCRAKKLIEVHEPRPFTLSDYGLHRGRLSSWYMRHYRDKYFSKVEKQSDVVVTLTPGDAHEWHCAKRVEIIPNFSLLPMADINDGTQQRVIAVGRLEWVKGFDRLLNAWSLVVASHPDWHLDIFGAGTLEQELNSLQQSLGIEKQSTIHPPTSAIGTEYAKSAFVVVTSHFEGFSLVLLEGMQAGLPCIAFDCPFGPASLIEDGINGFLVPDNDIKQLAEKMSRLMDDAGMRRLFSEASLRKSKDYSVETVMLKWQQLFEQLVQN